MGNPIDTDTGNEHPSTDTTSASVGTPPTLVCPDDATQALAWLPVADLTLTRAYDELPAPDAGKLREMAVSIAREGMLQPLLVTPSADGSHHEVVAGRRRWLAASASGRLVPALVRHFSPSQTQQAFLAAHVCTVTPASLDVLTTAYDATWTSVPADSLATTSDETNGETDNGVTGEAARVAAIVTQLQHLSPFGYRHLAREVVIKDTTLWNSLRADARQHMHESEASERERLAQELAVAHDAVRAAEQQQERHAQTLAQLGQHVTDAHMRYQRSEEQRQDSERLRHELSAENRQLQSHMQQLRTRLAAVRPIEQLAGQPQLATLAQAVMEIVVAAGPPLVNLAIRVLNPRTARDATAALARALDVVEERMCACRQRLTAETTVTTVDDTTAPAETEDSR